MGYHQAGFIVIGGDVAFQPHYPFAFVQMDAIEFLRRYAHLASAVHASPPCHKWSALAMLHQGRDYPDLIAKTRCAIEETGLPYVIENVPKAPLVNPIMLCGTMFGLETSAGSQLRRHRIFEVPWMEDRTTPPCNHIKGASVIGVHGGGQHPQRRKIPATITVVGNSGGRSNRDSLDWTCFNAQERQRAMGIDWLPSKQLSQAIPPPYTRWIGERLLKHLETIR